MFLSFFPPVKPSLLVCDISSFPDSEVSVVSGLSSSSSFNNILFPGRNGDKAVGFIYLCFFGIRFSGVVFTLGPPIKPDYPVDEDKWDVTESVSLFLLHTTTSSGAGASDWEIMCGFGFSYYFLINYLSKGTTDFS